MQKLLRIFDPNFYKALVTALLIIIPLYPKFPSIKLPGIYVAIRLEDFLIFGVLIFFLIPLVINFKTLLSNKISKSMLLFIAIGLVSLISGIFLTKTAIASIGFLHWFRRIEYLSLFVIGFLFMKLYANKNIFDYIIKVLVIVNLLIFLYGLGQKNANFPVIVTQNEEYSKGIALSWVPGSHINSTFAGHYDLASYLVLTLPIFITAFFVYKDKFSKLILFTSVLLGFWLLSSAVSRISIVAFLIASSISLFVLKKYKELLIVGLISVIAFGFSSDLRARYGRIIEVVREKISIVQVAYAQEIEVFEDRSTSIRLNVEWPRALRAFAKNPFLGTGYSSITLATDNDYLRALGETGFLGLIAFSLLLYNSIRVLILYKYSNDIDSAFIASILGSFVGILLTAVFIDIFEASKFATIFWLMIGITVGYIIINKHE